MNFHVGRGWEGHVMEDECPCPQEPCGLVATNRADPKCLHHPIARSKTMRQGHQEGNCPAQNLGNNGTP